ncbi:Hydroxyethylthiazole kinase [Leucoagaricus sp. SymC.cos]|nr:Hydroxyethylthiazole kinase [Leucoagaricus sp. SymC.cos]
MPIGGVTIVRIHEKDTDTEEITNNVVATQSANITLVLGTSPVMVTGPEEMEDLERITGSLLINIGTPMVASVGGMRKAGYYTNAFRKPHVFDPLGVGPARRKFV